MRGNTIFMKSKALKIGLNTTLSIVVFFVTGLLAAIVSGWILGSTTGADGTEEIKGGGATSIAILIVASITTIIFARLFHKFLTKYKVSKVKG